jgi:hypothetical protein
MALSPGTHGVVIVHGIGNPAAGDTIAAFAKAVCDTLINSPEGSIKPQVQLKSDVSVKIPTVNLHITSPSGEHAVWLCREAHWGDAFPPPTPTQVLWWGVNQNLRAQIASIFKMFRDPGNEDLNPDDKWKNAEKSVVPDAASEIQVRTKSGLSGFALIPATVFTYFILGLIWLLHFVPSIGPLDKVVSWVRKLDPFISISLGDIERYIDQEIWSANARARVEEIVIGMLKDPDIKDITIVAHSLGTILVYDALTEGNNIAEFLARSGGGKSGKKITFVSVGAAVNRVFEILDRDAAKSQRQPNREIRYNDFEITKPLAKIITGFEDKSYSGPLEDKFYWLDIYARRDPVPAGPVTRKIVKKAKIDLDRQWKERKVINKDSLLTDHVSYWDNKELVMPRILRAINGGAEYPWPAAGITKEKVAARIRKAFNYVSLSEIIWCLVMLAIVVLLVLILTGTISL